MAKEKWYVAYYENLKSGIRSVAGLRRITGRTSMHRQLPKDLAWLAESEDRYMVLRRDKFAD